MARMEVYRWYESGKEVTNSKTLTWLFNRKYVMPHQTYIEKNTTYTKTAHMKI